MQLQLLVLLHGPASVCTAHGTMHTNSAGVLPRKCGCCSAHWRVRGLSGADTNHGGHLLDEGRDWWFRNRSSNSFKPRQTPFLVLAHLSSHSHCKSIRPLQVNTHRPPLSGAPEPGKEVGPEVTELVGVRPEHSFEVAGVVSMQQAHHRRRQDHRSHRNGGLHCELRYNSKQIGCMIGCRVGFMVRFRI